MLKGQFGITSGAPFIEGRISFPRLEMRGRVSFLVDTGADGTVIMPRDGKMLGIDYGALMYPTTSKGIGGSARGYNEHAVLSFDNGRHIYGYLVQIEIPTPTEFNLRFPSLLGRDILKKWRFVMD